MPAASSEVPTYLVSTGAARCTSIASRSQSWVLACSALPLACSASRLGNGLSRSSSQAFQVACASLAAASALSAPLWFSRTSLGANLYIGSNSKGSAASRGTASQVTRDQRALSLCRPLAPLILPSRYEILGRDRNCVLHPILLCFGVRHRPSLPRPIRASLHRRGGASVRIGGFDWKLK